MRPQQFIKRGARPGVSTVVFAGDSITQGLGSASYVKLVERELGDQQFDFVNAGWAGDLAYNLWMRLDAIIACSPDVVTILIGTNDVAAHINADWMRGYERRQKPSEPPTLDYYRRTLSNIVQRLQAETTATLVLLEIPLLTEDPGNYVNHLGNRYNQVVHEIATAAGIPVLPIREAMIDALPAGHQPRPFDGSQKLTLYSLARRIFLRQSYDAISDHYGMHFLTDQVHLNWRGAKILADHIAGFLARTQGASA